MEITFTHKFKKFRSRPRRFHSRFYPLLVLVGACLLADSENVSHHLFTISLMSSNESTKVQSDFSKSSTKVLLS